MSDRQTAKPELCIVFPCYNEEDVLPHLFRTLESLDVGVQVRFLFVDDGSQDGTRKLLQEACKANEKIAYLSLSRNFGHQVAVQAGLKHAQGDLVAILDADLQDPPELLKQFITKWREGFDVVYGIRTNRKESWFLKTCYSSFYRILEKIANIQIPRDAGDFALMDRKIVNTLNAFPEHNQFVRGLRAWTGFKQIGVKYARPARYAGKSSYNMKRMTRFALDGLLSFSSAPLRLSAWLGAGSALMGFGYLSYALIVYISGKQLAEGWTSTVVLILFLGGIQLMMLGVLGEYLGRIFEEVKRRPHYVLNGGAGWIKTPAHQETVQ